MVLKAGQKIRLSYFWGWSAVPELLEKLDCKTQLVKSSVILIRVSRLLCWLFVSNFATEKELDLTEPLIFNLQHLIKSCYQQDSQNNKCDDATRDITIVIFIMS